MHVDYCDLLLLVEFQFFYPRMRKKSKRQWMLWLEVAKKSKIKRLAIYYNKHSYGSLKIREKKLMP